MNQFQSRQNPNSNNDESDRTSVVEARVPYGGIAFFETRLRREALEATGKALQHAEVERIPEAVQSGAPSW
ncbi:hypothetical protein E3N88_04671 [Mikania micrantha]|uniref:Uncharacterized protein n=1 Tax=Mikania micrantha TaxID=192012 RepID=A0A5N6PW11_9ASTR|nr:hypothetical protein E3N88_04671 [Mikania micrantha]